MITQNAEEFKIQLRNPYVKRLTPVFSRVTFEGLNEPFLERSIDENFGRNCESSELSILLKSQAKIGHSERNVSVMHDA
jgi:hypothetical protein